MRQIVMRSATVTALCGLGVAAVGCDVSEAEAPIEIISVETGVGIPACEPERAGERTAASGPVVIRGGLPAPCRVVAVRQVQMLKPSATGKRPDPSWNSIARASDGRMYTPATLASGPGMVLEWSADGMFLESLGSPGSGPGELSGKGLPRVFVGPADSIYVRDGVKWTVFGPDHSYGRTITSPAIQGIPRHLHILRDGRFLSTGRVGGAPTDQWFHIFDPEGYVVQSFGSVDSGDAETTGMLPPRPSAYDGDTTFWAALPVQSTGELVLEQWSINGHSGKVIRREADWIHAEVVRGGQQLPDVRILHLDEHGRLWIVVLVEDAEGRSIEQERAPDEAASELYDIRYEVLDPQRGMVLASGRLDNLPGEDERDVPPIASFIAGRAASYRPLPDSLGSFSIEFFELRLAPRNFRTLEEVTGTPES
ncbi:MAG: hypothetical protein WEA24_11795 [Gemmatimonadota bacterium]